MNKIKEIYRTSQFRIYSRWDDLYDYEYIRGGVRREGVSAEQALTAVLRDEGDATGTLLVPVSAVGVYYKTSGMSVCRRKAFFLQTYKKTLAS